ncbi:MAG: outer membrane lipoprotein-sorting protein [Nitrospira sp.]|nr:outer membrane lipoprotein-sorting protein [Nitrospira sp.]MBH0181563.1 outer membrane lipoprotein-sorting protein [Nitrospira sp.]MBH0184707.1 outer membrane lipoprotein-sorting protein [Nitrospira sp.]
MRHMYIALFLLFPLFVFNAAAETLPAGEEIARRINARDEGEVVSRFVTMAMTDRSGTERVRETKSFRKYFGKEKRTVIFYLSPANIKDTAFLTYDYPEVDRDDDQWLYLPAVRKVRRISASDRGDYFLGTDFTYEDIRMETKVGIEDYSWKTLAEETIDGHRCFLVEEIPVNEKTAKELGYSKVQSWVDAEIWMVRQAKYWDVAGNPLKTLQVREITLIRDIWTAHQISVENHKTGHKTVFTFKDVNYGQSVKDELFTEDGLRRGF